MRSMPNYLIVAICGLALISAGLMTMIVAGQDAEATTNAEQPAEGQPVVELPTLTPTDTPTPTVEIIVAAPTLPPLPPTVEPAPVVIPPEPALPVPPADPVMPTLETVAQEAPLPEPTVESPVVPTDLPTVESLAVPTDLPADDVRAEAAARPSLDEAGSMQAQVETPVSALPAELTPEATPAASEGVTSLAGVTAGRGVAGLDARSAGLSAADPGSDVERGAAVTSSGDGALALPPADSPAVAVAAPEALPATLAPALPLPAEESGEQPASTVAPAVETPVPPTAQTDAASHGQITGVVQYALAADHAGISVRLTLPDGSTRDAVTDAAGAFQFDQVSAGSYTLEARAVSSLAIATTFTLEAGQTFALPPAILPGGDVNADGRIDLADAAMIAANFNGPASVIQTDLNRDGWVDISDLALVGAQYGQYGPLPWG